MPTFVPGISELSRCQGVSVLHRKISPLPFRQKISCLSTATSVFLPTNGLLPLPTGFIRLEGRCIPEFLLKDFLFLLELPQTCHASSLLLRGRIVLFSLQCHPTPAHSGFVRKGNQGAGQDFFLFFCNRSLQNPPWSGPIFVFPFLSFSPGCCLRSIHEQKRLFQGRSFLF